MSRATKPKQHVLGGLKQHRHTLSWSWGPGGQTSKTKMPPGLVLSGGSKGEVSLASDGHCNPWCPLACGRIITQHDHNCSPLHVFGFSPCLFLSGFRAYPEFRVIPSPPLPKLFLQRPLF